MEASHDKILEWWNDNPFVYSFEKKEVIPDEHFFNEINRKFIKWTPWAQDDARPLSKVIDFKSLQDKKVLDIAIGTGWSTAEFAKAGAQVTGIDLTPQAIEISKKRFEVLDLPHADLRVADAQSLPFEDNTFDFVLAWGCLMHMPDTQKALNELHRVLKPGGRIVAMMYNKHSLHWWWYIVMSKGILRAKLLHMSMQQLANRYTDGVYQGGNELTKFFSKTQVRNLFLRFTNTHVAIHDTTTPIDHFPHKSLSWGSYLPCTLRKFFARVVGQSLWITAQKSGENSDIRELTVDEALKKAFTILSPWSDPHRHEIHYYKKVITLLHTYVPKGTRILDMGCGVGIIPLSARLLGYDAEGLEKYVLSNEHSPMFAVDAPDKLMTLLSAHGVTLHNGDVINPDTSLYGTYGAVINTALIEHLKDPKLFLSRVHSLLGDNGVVITMTPNLSVLYKRIRFLCGASPYWDIRSFFDLGELGFVGHWREYTQKELRQMHEWANFVIRKELHTDIFNLREKKSLRNYAHRVLRAVSFLIPESREAHIVVAQKK